jgi:hypothetical protein
VEERFPTFGAMKLRRRWGTRLVNVRRIPGLKIQTWGTQRLWNIQ